MRYMSIDPGETTGVALFNPEFESIVTFCMKLSEVDIQISRHLPNVIVLERKPKFDNWTDEVTEGYYNIIRLSKLWEIRLERITPGLWKPFKKALGWKNEKSYTVHEKDAYFMLRYFLQVYKNIIVGDLI